MSPVDSGEYVCRVVGGSVPLEASVLVTIEPAGSVPGEWCCGKAWLGTQQGEAPHPAVAGAHETNSPPLPHPALLPSHLGLTLCLSSPALGVTPPVRIESSSSHVAEGQTLDLNCLVAGQAHAQITWHRRGGSLPAQHQVGGGELGSPEGPPLRW